MLLVSLLPFIARRSPEGKRKKAQTWLCELCYRLSRLRRVIFLQNMPGIDKDIFLSLPCLVNANGVRGIAFQELADNEKERIYNSAKELEQLILSIEW